MSTAAISAETGFAGVTGFSEMTGSAEIGSKQQADGAVASRRDLRYELQYF